MKQSENLLSASRELVKAYTQGSATSFEAGMQAATDYQNAYHELSNLQRRQYCLEYILDPGDVEYNAMIENPSPEEERRGR